MRHGVIAASLIALTLLAYQPAWTAGWVYEDTAMRVSAAGWDPTAWQARPLTYLTWWVAPTPRSAHVLGVGLHLLVAGLLVAFVRQLGGTMVMAWLAALVWMLHPLTAETAAYAKARGEALIAVGALCACLGATGRWWRPRAFLAVTAGVLIALAAEPAGVVVLLLVPLTAGWCHDRAWQDRPRWAPAWLPTVCAAVLVAGGIAWYGGIRAVVNADGNAAAGSFATAVTWSEWALAQGGALWYWSLTLAQPERLTVDADIDILSMTTRVLGLGLLAGCAVLAWYWRRRQALLAFGLTWFLLAVGLRFLVQTPRSYLNAQHLYLPFIGVVLVIGRGGEALHAAWTT